MRNDRRLGHTRRVGMAAVAALALSLFVAGPAYADSASGTSSCGWNQMQGLKSQVYAGNPVSATTTHTYYVNGKTLTFTGLDQKVSTNFPHSTGGWYIGSPYPLATKLGFCTLKPL